MLADVNAWVDAQSDNDAKALVERIETFRKSQRVWAPDHKIMPAQYAFPTVLTDALPRRWDIPAWLEEHSFNKAGLEIGVSLGHFSQHILDKWPGCSQFYGIDPWDTAPNHSSEKASVTKQRGNERKETMRRVAPWSDKTQMLAGFSSDRMKDVPDNSLDFAYVDGCHNYDSVMQDLLMIWPKLRNGGILAGHDIVLPSTKGVRQYHWERGFGGVVKPLGIPGAVNDFAALKGIRFYMTWRESTKLDKTCSNHPSYIMQKPADYVAKSPPDEIPQGIPVAC